MIWLVIWIVMGVLVGLIARNLKRDPMLWGLYGFLIWPVALIHLLIVGERKAGGDGPV